MSVRLLSAFALLAVPGLAGAWGPILTPITKGPTVIELRSVAAGLNRPNYVTHAGDGTGRRFVLELDGKIRSVGPGGLSPTPFLDITSRVLTGSERGLLGLAFHPGYADASSPGFGKFYTLTSEAASGGTSDFPAPGGVVDHHSVLAEWSVSASDPFVADPASRREVLRLSQPQGNHNGGAIAFKPGEQSLYVAVGDGGNGNDLGPGHSTPDGNGQDAGNVLGDILRIDPLSPSVSAPSAGAASANGNYRVPGDNPFIGATPGVDEIFATGFRNPYRMSFDRLDGRLLVGDVGQGNIEEVDIVTSGGNYGWRFKEGTFRFDAATGGVFVGADPVPGLVDPWVQYDHDEGVSVIGGFVYRGAALPELFGDYVFGDLNGRLFRGDFGTGLIDELIIGLDDRPLGGSLLGFGEDEEGELYVAATNFSPAGGTVYQITPAAVPEPSGLVLLLLTGAVAAVAECRKRRRARVHGGATR